MSRRILGGTRLCVRCLKRKAVRWGGHVTSGSADVLAGWCKKCDVSEGTTPNKRWPGWVGHYLARMGTEQEHGR